MNRYDWKVDLPAGECDGARIVHFTVDRAASALTAFRGGRNWVPEGDYTKLVVDGRLWMSDTLSEWQDHIDAYNAIRTWGEPARVLINGLGIGMVVKAALSFDHVQHIDVVEIDERVIKLVGPTYEADPRVTIHHADAYEIDWPKGTRWNVAWHDVWENLDWETNLPLMAKLHRKYGRRVDWQGSWGKRELENARRRDQYGSHPFGRRSFRW